MAKVYVVRFWGKNTHLVEVECRATEKSLTPHPEHTEAWEKAFGTYMRMTNRHEQPTFHNGVRVYGYDRQAVIDAASDWLLNQAEKYMKDYNNAVDAVEVVKEW